MIICHTRETNFRRPPLAELGVGARFFAGNTEGGRVGRPWDGRAAAAVGWRSGAAGFKKLY